MGERDETAGAGDVRGNRDEELGIRNEDEELGMRDEELGIRNEDELLSVGEK